MQSVKREETVTEKYHEHVERFGELIRYMSTILGPDDLQSILLCHVEEDIYYPGNAGGRAACQKVLMIYKKLMAVKDSRATALKMRFNRQRPTLKPPEASISVSSSCKFATLIAFRHVRLPKQPCRAAGRAYQEQKLWKKI